MSQPMDYPFYVEQNLQWGEMDALGHVNNTVYFKFFENSRIEFMDQSGFSAACKGKTGPILAAIQANFKRPLVYPDTIRTYLRIGRIGTSSFTVENAIWSKDQDAIVCTGEGTVVFFDYAENKSVPLPDHLRLILEKFQ